MSSSTSPLVPPQVVKSTFALFWGLRNENTNDEEETTTTTTNKKNARSIQQQHRPGGGDDHHDDNLFLGTAFAIAPCVALTAGHHIRLNFDDCGKLNLRAIGTDGFDDDDDEQSDEEHDEEQPQPRATRAPSAATARAAKQENKDRQRRRAHRQKICARVSYVQKDSSVDILVMWLDRPVAHFVPLRAFHPLVGQKVMLVSAAISEPHSDVVVSTGVVSRSPENNPDAVSTLCRAQGLVSARGYSGSLVLEYLGAEATTRTTTPTSSSSSSHQLQQQHVYTPLPKQRVLGMHVSVYQDKSTNDNIEVEFVSSYRILRMMSLYNVDVYSLYARGKAKKNHYHLHANRDDTSRRSKGNDEDDERDTKSATKTTAKTMRRQRNASN